MRQYKAVGFALGLISAVACSSSDNHGGGTSGTGGVLLFGSSGGGIADGSTGKGNGASGATNASGSGNGGTTGTDNGGPTPGHGAPVTNVTPASGSSACASQALGAGAGSLDIFIMLDKSQSMSDKTANGSSKWDVITQALDDFVNDPKSAGIDAGIGFFGIGGGGSSRNNDTSCTAADYANPVVPIDALPPNAKPIANAIGRESPSGNTPTEPALHGAINYASQWAQQHPTHKVIVVFATDGLPNGCSSSVAGAAAIAAAGVKGPPPILTYVIGVFGDQDCPGGVTQGQQCDVVTNTNQIAKGGGTQSAFIVNSTSGDTGAQFLQALNSIRTANAIGCDFAVPAPSGGKVVDFSRATVEYTPGGGSATSLSWVASASACDPKSGGWYYDSATAPNHMLLCDASCTEVKADPMAKVDVTLDCLPPGTHSSGGAPGTGGTTACLLDGQSCTSAGDCCNRVCSGGICAAIR